MRTHHVALTLALAAPLAACAVEATDPAPDDAALLTYAKDITVSDGVNEVTLTIASDDEAVLDRYGADTFEIVPIFERPAQPAAAADGPEDAGEHHDFTDAVSIEERSATLEDGAIGYELRYVGAAVWSLDSCTSPNVHKSSRDFATVTITDGSTCTETKISTKKYSWSWYVQQGYASSLCPGNSLDGGKSGSHTCKVQICPGPGYTVSFYN